MASGPHAHLEARTQGRLRDVRLWAAEQGCTVELNGEVGFGRSCVGVLWRTSYVDTPGSGFNAHGPCFGSDSIGGPPNGVDAYHKHDCLCVLGTDERAIDGLLTWVEKIRANGGRIVVKDRDEQPDNAFSLMLHGTRHAVVEFDSAPPAPHGTNG
jgi:hypothetical protein